MQSANRWRLDWVLIVAFATLQSQTVFARLTGEWDKGADRRISTIDETVRTDGLIFTPGKPHHALVLDHVPAVNVWSALTTLWPEMAATVLVLSPIIVFFFLRRRHMRLSTRRFCARCRYEMPPPPAAVPVVCSECGADLTHRHSLCRGEPMTLATGLVVISVLAFVLGYFTFLRKQSRFVPFRDAFNWPSIRLYEQAEKRRWDLALLDRRYIPMIREVDLSDGMTTRLIGPFPFAVARIELAADRQHLLVYDDGGALGLPQLRRTASIVNGAVSEQSRSAAMTSNDSPEIVSDESANHVVLRALQERGMDLAAYEKPVLEAAVISRDGTRAFFANDAYVYALDLSDPLSQPHPIKGSHRWGYESLTLSADGKWLIAVSCGVVPDDLVLLIDVAQERVVEVRTIRVPGIGGPARFSPDGKHLVVPQDWSSGVNIIDL